MRKLGFIMAAAGALAFATPALAGPLPIIPKTNPGVAALPAYIHIDNRTFSSNFGSDAGTSGTAYAPPLGSQESVSGNVNLYSTTVDGVAIKPDVTGLADGQNFLGILAGGEYKITFNNPANVLSFVLGGLDYYNYVKLNFVNDTTTYILRGNEIRDGSSAAVGGENGTWSGQVTYDFGASQLSSVIFGTTSNTLEITSVVAAAPEPATWAMMIFGFGLVGGALRRRRNEGKRAFA